jgi:Flp pilus assembly protein TadD
MTDVTHSALLRGRSLLELGRPVEAERCFREALAQHPDDAELLSELARALLEQERWDDAAGAARRSLAADPDHVEAMFLLARAYAARKHYDRAMELVDTALQHAPEEMALHSLKGAILARQGLDEAALTHIARARALAPEHPDVVAQHAAILYDLRRNAEAAQAVADALALDPDHVGAHRIRGLLALRSGGSREAVEASRQALRLDPTNTHQRQVLAVAMKARNPLYAWLYRLQDWQAGLPKGARYAIILGPYVASRALRPFEDHLWAQVLLVVIWAAVLVSWTVEPIMNAVLLCSRFGRALLPRGATVATIAFLAYAVAAFACVADGLTSGGGEPLLLAFALGVWGVSAGQTHTVRPRLRTIAVALQTAGGLAALTALAMLVTTGSAGVLTLLLLLGGVAMLWFTSFA